MSTADDYPLVQEIATACYGMQARIELITRSNNPVYRLWFGDVSKVLKFSNAEQAVRKELMLIALLRKHDVPVPVIEHDDSDGTLVGNPFFIMESAGVQTVMQHLKSAELSRGLLRDMGILLAKIHAITFPTAGDIQHDRIVPRDPRLFLSELYLAADRFLEQGLLEPAEVSLLKSIEVPQTDGVSLCHSDFHTVQCVVNNGRITAVVDWESAWSGNPLIDLAITHAYLDYYCPMELTRCFFAGYSLIQSLPNDYDLRYLPVRMAHVVGLMRVWQRQGTEAWQSAVERKKVDRAIALYRAYCLKWNSAVHP
jgi:aminoglycoside phosphotransferase (APT) family kinase protein